MNEKQRLKLLDSYCHSIDKGHYKKALEQNQQLFDEIYNNLRLNNNKKKAFSVLRELNEAAVDIKGCLGVLFFNLNFPEVK